MKKLTSNKEVSEMSMFELAHNACYTKHGKARYRDYNLDIDARELTRRLLKDYAEGDDSFIDDNDFDDWMMDYLQDGIDGINGLIALFYRNLWAMADLRERLKEYEDTGIMPEQIREIDRLYAEKCKELSEIQKNYLTGMELANMAIGLKKLKEYQDLEEQGKLLKLPCTVGDTVYCIMTSIKGTNPVIFSQKFDYGMIESFGKAVFLTREEAEVALKEL